MDRNEEVHISLGNDIDGVIERAQSGELRAWAELYGKAGALLAVGHALPEPLRTVIAERLSALGTRLSWKPIGDIQGALRDVITPTSRPQRVVGRKHNSRTREAAELVANILATDKTRGSRDKWLRAISPGLGVEPETLGKALDAVRKERRGN